MAATRWTLASEASLLSLEAQADGASCLQSAVAATLSNPFPVAVSLAGHVQVWYEGYDGFDSRVSVSHHFCLYFHISHVFLKQIGLAWAWVHHERNAACHQSRVQPARRTATPSDPDV